MGVSGWQMSERPRAHEVEDGSLDRLHDASHSVGWTVEELYEDYGEDLLGIFDQGTTTPLVFFVQAKGTDRIQNYTSAAGLISIPLKRKHVNNWIKFSEPVFVTLWDSKSDLTYFNSVQTYFSTEEGKAAFAGIGDALPSKLTLL